MVRGLYTAYTGMMNQQARLDVITNNLANASTVGYKKEGSTSQAFDSMYTQKIKDGSEYYINRTIGKESLGVKIGETYTDYTQGSFKVTGNTYDLAIYAIFIVSKITRKTMKNDEGRIFVRYFFVISIIWLFYFST